MKTTLPFVLLSCVALGLTACGRKYEVFTCTFGSGATGCTPIRASDYPREVFDMQFSLVNPNNPVPGCGGDFHLGVSSSKGGYLTWSAHEKDPNTCAYIGDEMSGEQALDGTEKTVDTTFPQGSFVFRVVVLPQE